MILFPSSVTTGNRGKWIRHLEIQISRQAGKTESLVNVITFVLLFAPYILGRAVRIIIFAPQREQAKTDFDRIKERLAIVKQAGYDGIEEEESNATTLILSNRSFAYIFPLSPTSNPESKTADIIIFEEANSIDDRQKKNKADPMLASTNGAEISIGVGGYRKNYYQKRVVQGENLIKVSDDEVIKERREAYNRDGNPFHLNYEQFVLAKREDWGVDSDEYRTQFKLEFVLGSGQFVTEEMWNSLLAPRAEHKPEHKCVAGLDTAKHPDSTVCWIKCTECRQRIAMLELRGENYPNQFQIITGFDTEKGKQVEGFLSKHRVVAIALDSTGQGDFMPDMFQKHTRWQDEFTGLYRVKFNLSSKNDLYKNYQNAIINKTFTIPEDDDSNEARKCKEQHLDLQKEYKGEFLSVHHPSDTVSGEVMHDDYPDAGALAEWAHHKWAELGDPQIITM